MNAQQFEKLLEKIGACESAREWAKGKSLAETWEQCERGDWLLWLAHRMSGKKGWPNRKAVVLACCACAETALKLVPADEHRPLLCIQTARRWAVGQASSSELKNAADQAAGVAWATWAAEAARAAGAVEAAGAARAAGAAEAARAAGAVEAAGAARAAGAAWASGAAEAARAAGAVEAAGAASLKETADIVRRHLTIPGGNQ